MRGTFDGHLWGVLVVLLVVVPSGCRDFIAPAGSYRIPPEPEWAGWYAEVRACVVGTRGRTARDDFGALRFYAYPPVEGDRVSARMDLPNDIYVLSNLLRPVHAIFLRKQLQHEFVHQQLQVTNAAHDWPEFGCAFVGI